MEVLSLRVLMLAFVGVCLASSVAYAAEGTATFYNSYTPSACYGYQEQGVMIAAASEAIWENGAACGRNYRVRCIDGTNGTPDPCKDGSTVVVKVIDLCPPGCSATIDLSQEAFAAIANTDAGKIRVQFDWVD